jgi:hypothetical protein
VIYGASRRARWVPPLNSARRRASGRRACWNSVGLWFLGAEFVGGFGGAVCFVLGWFRRSSFSQLVFSVSPTLFASLRVVWVVILQICVGS